MASVLKWQTMSSKPSPFMSLGVSLQTARLVSLPVRPKVGDVASTYSTPSNRYHLKGMGASTPPFSPLKIR